MDKVLIYEKVINDLSHYFQGYAIDRTAKMSIIASTLSNKFPDWIFCGFYRVVDEKLLEIFSFPISIVLPSLSKKFLTAACVFFDAPSRFWSFSCA